MAIILRVEGKTRELGRAQGYLPLPVRDEFVTFEDKPGMALHIMVTTWELTPDERTLLAAGGNIELRIYGASMPVDQLSVAHSGHPPVNITVGQPPTDEIENG